MSTEVNLIPDFKRLFDQFARNAKIHANCVESVLSGDNEEVLESLREIQGLMASLNVCAQSVDSVEAIGKLRDLMAEVTATIVAEADKLENKIMDNLPCDICGKKRCTDEHPMEIL